LERSIEGRLALAGPFAEAARRYWLGIFPGLCRERRRRRSQALAIPDPLLRDTALAALQKWGNVEGAVAFAAFVPPFRRSAAAHAMACFQAAYNYLDMLSEQPSADPAAAARSLHGALLEALNPDLARGTGADRHERFGSGEEEVDYYEHFGSRDDGGYLAGLIGGTRAALAGLPAYPAFAEYALGAAQRIVEFQSANTGRGSQSGRQEALAALERWGEAHTPPGSGLRWWETAAAAGSSLGVYALIGLAASEPDEVARARAYAPFGDSDRTPRVRAYAPFGNSTTGGNSPPGALGSGGGPASGWDLGARAKAIDRAYFPWIGALHSLLDNLIDTAEDRAAVQHNLVGCYSSAQEAADRMGMLAERASGAARQLADSGQGQGHMLVLAAMASFYLATPESKDPSARPVADAVLEALGASTGLTMPVFRARLAARSLLPSAWRRQRGAETVAPVRERGLGERAYRVRVHEREA
jgi:tetraprenyl-beta-curcumene synthase